MINHTTGEIFDKTMKLAEYEQFKIDNPDITRYFTSEQNTPLGDPVRLGITKPDSTFQKYVIDRIKNGVAGNNLKNTQKISTPREW